MSDSSLAKRLDALLEDTRYLREQGDIRVAQLDRMEATLRQDYEILAEILLQFRSHGALIEEILRRVKDEFTAKAFDLAKLWAEEDRAEQERLARRCPDHGRQAKCEKAGCLYCPCDDGVHGQCWWLYDPCCCFATVPEGEALSRREALRPRAAAIVAALMADPDLDARLRAPEMAHTIEAWAQAEAICELVRASLIERGMPGLATGLNELHKAETRAASLRHELGIRKRS